ncbi:MAG: aminotransferase class I/II-fold pyridoxal phosphate-dependent enzyme [Clostridiales bacterium]|nr:aminotransferase class I/II-fold pyridoxal phosphate-dependent enzyme [Clostridiales bacterium]
MQAIILAAGMGKRLKHLTKDKTKCMVEVNGRTLISRTLDILETQGLTRIIIVTGYKGDTLRDYVESLNIKTPVEFIDNPIYDKTNNIYSLALARDKMIEDDTLLFESDLIFEKEVVDRLVADPRPTLATVALFESWMSGTCLKIDKEDKIVDFIPGKYLDFSDKHKYYKTVNIYKFSKEFSSKTYVPFLTAYEKAVGENEYYESVIKLIAMIENTEIRVMKLGGERWYEIDDALDLDIASYIFTEDPVEKYKLLAKRYGGHWRFPKLIDYCYLVNPYFPTARMENEMVSNYGTLMRQYPSGMEVNSLLASEVFGVSQKNILVGNGAAELIKSLAENHLTGRTGVIRPTFEEYPNRMVKDNVVAFAPSDEEFRYGADELMAFFADKDIDNLVLVNPDNPSGNYIPVSDLLRIADWCEDKGIAFVLDESFGDFATGFGTADDITLLHDEILEKYKNLIVVKSISKSFGVPGFRLGVLASGNTELISSLKKEVAIWNINSFGEFYMQIYEKYKKNYISSLEKHGKARAELVEGLKSIPYLKVFPSQANFIMCEVTGGRTSLDLCANILVNEDILIKDLSSKVKNGRQYIRIAVRDEADNARLIEALKRA